MGRLRIPIAGMLVAVVAFAMAFAALRSGSSFWFGSLYTISIIVLLVALIAARFRRGAERAFWYGFAVFGWGFFLLGSGRFMSPVFAKQGEVSGVNSTLLTSKVALLLYTHLKRDTADVDGIDDIMAYTLCVIHLLMTACLAIAGGFLAILVRGRRGSASPRSVKSAAAVSLSILSLLILVPVLTSLGEGGPAAAAFFPAQPEDGPGGLGEFRVEWYSKHLKAMKEPSLWGLSRNAGGPESYRLLLLPSFTHPIAVRITKDGVGATLRAVVLTGKGGYEPGRVAIDRTLSLDAGQWAGLEKEIEAAEFWSLPTTVADDSGTDGEQYVVEGLKGGRYHVVDRWEPDPAYKELIGHIFGLSGLKMRGGLR